MSGDNKELEDAARDVAHDMLSGLIEAGVEDASHVLTLNLVKMCLRAGLLKRPAPKQPEVLHES